MNLLRRMLGFHVHTWGLWVRDSPKSIWQSRVCSTCGYTQEKSTLAFWS
jgi:hypothetical protein